MNGSTPSIRGRGASTNPPNRFEPLRYETELDWSDVPDEDRPPPQTRYYRDRSESIIARNDSPDIPFACSINPFRGCLHGCPYYRLSPGASRPCWHQISIL